MAEPYVRLYFRRPNGDIEDAGFEVNLSDFAGFLPNVGDVILEPGVAQGLDRREPKNRTFWEVVQRVFNARDDENFVALIVEQRRPTPAEYDLLPRN